MITADTLMENGTWIRTGLAEEEYSSRRSAPQPMAPSELDSQTRPALRAPACFARFARALVRACAASSLARHVGPLTVGRAAISPGGGRAPAPKAFSWHET